MTLRELTAEEWRERLHQNLNPRELLESLRSKTLSLDDKDQIFIEFPGILHRKLEKNIKNEDREKPRNSPI